MQPQNEVDKFFGDLPKQDEKVADVFNDKKPTEQVEKTEEVKETEEQQEARKNRRHRRLEEQLQREREANIALNERLKTLTETERFIKDTGTDLDPDLIRVFGASKEGEELAKIFSSKLKSVSEETRQRALEEFEQRQNESTQRERQEQEQAEKFIDSELDFIEEQYNVDLTSNTPQAIKARKEFLGLIEQLSPKSSDGTITDYADFGSTFEIYQRMSQGSKSDNTRQKEIASRSMQRSESNSGTQTKITPGFDGWKKDFGVE